MAFLIGGANSASGGYEVSNSLRWNNPSDDNLAITFGSAGNRRIFTISAWVKRGLMNDDHALIGQGGTASGNPRGLLFFDNSLRFTNNTAGNSTDTDVNTNAKTRDPAAWYHVVAAVDTTQSTNTNRVKLYINGVHQTSLATATYPDEDFEMNWNNAVLHTVGRYPNNDSYHMDGYISEFYFIDGTQYAASDFGEYDGDSGIWIPKNAKGALTFGDNGFYLEFKQTGTDTDASGMGADTSGEDNHLAVNNLTAVDVTADTPTNNFATLNPLNKLNGALSEGNTQFVRAASGTANSVSTMCPSNGKWYMEFQNSAAQNSAIGVVNVDDHPSTTNIYPYTYAAAILLETNLIATILYDEVASDGETSRSTASGAGTTKIGMAVDLDNQDIYISTNGQWWGGSSFNQGTGPATALITDLPTTGFAAGFYINGSIANACYYNFGNPGGADSISSGNADANGYGNFEYAVPSGYFALCTKNLAEYG